MENKKILILGGSGSIGTSLIKKYKNNNEIIIFSRDENKQYLLKQEHNNVKFIIGDIRNKNSLEKCINYINPNIIIVASALKHIDICETNTQECIDTNIIGIRNVIDCTLNLNNLIVVFISTDKACSPITTYGMCKSISERMIIEASTKSRIKYICVRYGNVINSRGSLIPKLVEISKSTQTSFPLTEERMTRFFMTLEDAIELIETSILQGNSGEIWIPKTNSFKIRDILEFFSKKYNKHIENIGIRGIEKIDEILINEYEAPRAEYRKINNKEYYVLHSCYDNKIYDFVKSIYSSNETSDISILEEKLNNLI